MELLPIGQYGIVLDCHPRSMDSLPSQAFAINLSDDAIEDMIKCVEDGQGIDLLIGDNPSFTYGAHTEPIVPTTDKYLFDLFISDRDHSGKVVKFPNRPFSIKPISLQKETQRDSDAATNSRLTKPTHKCLSTTATASTILPRSLPASPMNSLPSPAQNPAMTASQQYVSRAREQRFLIVHELAIRDQTEAHLLAKWKGNEVDFKPVLEKAAEFIDSSKTWRMKKNIWKELDVYKYDYESDVDRQLAIDNAIKQFDRSRLSVKDPLWQKLLPYEERGKGKCLSKLQMGIMKAAAPMPIINPKSTSEETPADGEDAKPDKSTGAKSRVGNAFVAGGVLAKKKATPKAKPKPRTITAAASTPPTSAAGKTIASKTAVNGTASRAPASTKPKPRILSQEIITNSDESSDDEQPLAKGRPASLKTPSSNTMANKSNKVTVAAKTEVSSLTPGDGEVEARLPPKSSASAVTSSTKKRAREDDDSSSSSSGTPLSKRAKPTARGVGEALAAKSAGIGKASGLEKTTSAVKAASTTKVAGTAKVASVVKSTSTGKTSSIAKTGGGAKASSPAVAKTVRAEAATAQKRPNTATAAVGVAARRGIKSTAPAKSSPLASSPPTNMSDLDEDDEDEETPSPPPAKRVTQTRPTSQAVGGRKRKTDDKEASQQPSQKKVRVSKEVMSLADEFMECYPKYEALHHELAGMDNPPEKRLNTLCAMRDKLMSLKKNIYDATGVPFDGTHFDEE